MSKSRPAGFTLVEMLVVITIIGILVGLLLPVLGTMRENARRIQCSNNLREIGRAILSHYTAKNCFPTGGDVHHPDIYNYMTAVPPGGMPNDPETQGLGWAYQILPYLDNEVVYSYARETSILNAASTNRVIPPQPTGFTAYPSSSSASLQQWAIQSTPIPLFFCPTRRRVTRSRLNPAAIGAALLDYAGATPYVNCNYRSPDGPCLPTANVWATAGGNGPNTQDTFPQDQGAWPPGGTNPNSGCSNTHVGAVYNPTSTTGDIFSFWQDLGSGSSPTCPSYSASGTYSNGTAQEGGPVPPGRTWMGVIVRSNWIVSTSGNSPYSGASAGGSRPTVTIPDGSGFTMLVGEKRMHIPEWQTGDTDNYSYPSTASSAAGATRDFGDSTGWADGWDPNTMRLTSLPPGRDCDPRDLLEVGYMFGSAHNDIFNVVFADGSVHAITYLIDQRTFNYLGNKEDGYALDARQWR